RHYPPPEKGVVLLDEGGDLHAQCLQAAVVQALAEGNHLVQQAPPDEGDHRHHGNGPCACRGRELDDRIAQQGGIGTGGLRRFNLHGLRSTICIRVSHWSFVSSSSLRSRRSCSSRSDSFSFPPWIWIWRSPGPCRRIHCSSARTSMTLMPVLR